METNIVHFKNSQNMDEVESESISLIITSPPYYNIKDYSKDGYQDEVTSESTKGQIGDIQDYDEYQNELLKVWKECERVLQPNGKLCINVPLMPILKRYNNMLSISAMGHFLNRTLWHNQAALTNSLRSRL